MWWIYALSGLIILILYSLIRNAWEKPQAEIIKLKKDIETLQKLHKEELTALNRRRQNSSSLCIQDKEFSDIILTYAWKELSDVYEKEFVPQGLPQVYSSFAKGTDSVIEPMKKRFREALDEQYRYQYLIRLYPEFLKIFKGDEIVAPVSGQPTAIAQRSEKIFEVVNILKKNSAKAEELIYLKNKITFLESTRSNLTAIPYMAEIMADYETYGLERLARELDWGYSIKRTDKIKSIREIRKDAKEMVEKNKYSQYQLAYLLKLFPVLEDVIDTEFNRLPVVEVSELPAHDPVRDYMSKEEYSRLSECEKNQLALDRYRQSNKTKWQIGRDYELYVGYRYSLKGYDVDYFGSYMGLEDLGRDLIAKKNDQVLIIQCKYWSSKKEIHEKHITQLYGTMISFCIENNIEKDRVKGILITNITLSPMAKNMASYLGIQYVEGYEKGNYPCIKCNIGHGKNGEITKIYHLPFDQQYDTTKIKNNGEFYATTVAEAEAAGFRRSYKWSGTE